MAGTSRKTGKRTFEVLVSFSALNKGDRFTQDADDLGWATQHVETGYLRDVTDEPTAGEAQGQQAPEAPVETVQEARDGGRGEVGQG